MLLKNYGFYYTVLENISWFGHSSKHILWDLTDTGLSDVLEYNP